MNMRSGLLGLLAGCMAAGLIVACVPESTDGSTLVRLSWTAPGAAAPSTTAPLSTMPTTTAPATTAPPTAPTTTAAVPTPPPPSAPPTSARPTAGALAKLSWVCRSDDSVASQQRRHAAFVRNIASSDLPAVSQGKVLRQLPRIEANLPLYCVAERATGVPALVLAAVHYREADNDPARSIMSGEAIGAVNPDTHLVEGTTPLENAIDAGRHLVTGAAEIYGVRVGLRMNSIDVAYALAAYNRGGRYCRAGQLHPMLSPYVAAGLIASNVVMSWPDVGGDDGDGPEAWGEPSSVRGRPDPRIGALTLMRGLGSEITAPAFAWNTAEVVIPCR